MSNRRIRYGGPHESLHGIWGRIRRGKLAFLFFELVAAHRERELDDDVFQESMSGELAINRTVHDPEEWEA